ncbi:hypothetical protein DL96DRAFT_928823 [Flagelloscypha sp. PMI_526]|nr:hypothetical protein DL96DRAFT_928823 [Flagelloscypha sp. PMI_526]
MRLVHCWPFCSSGLLLWHSWKSPLFRYLLEGLRICGNVESPSAKQLDAQHPMESDFFATRALPPNSLETTITILHIISYDSSTLAHFPITHLLPWPNHFARRLSVHTALPKGTKAFMLLPMPARLHRLNSKLQTLIKSDEKSNDIVEDDVQGLSAFLPWLSFGLLDADDITPDSMHALSDNERGAAFHVGLLGASRTSSTSRKTHKPHQHSRYCHRQSSGVAPQQC